MLVLVCLIIVFLQHTISQLDSSIYWKEWYLLEISEPIQEVDAALHLRKHGIDDFLAASNTVIPYMAIPHLENLSIASLDTVLSYEDPRRDPFIVRVGSLFKSGEKSLIFLPAARSLSFYSDIIAKHSSPTHWKLLDRNPLGRSLFKLGIFIFLVSMIAISMSRKLGAIPLLLVPVLPWLFFIIFSRSASPYIGVVLYLLTFEELKRQRLILFRIILITVVLGMQFYLCIPADRPDFILAVTGSSFIIYAKFIFMSRIDHASQMNPFPVSIFGKEHTLFTPILLTYLADSKRNNTKKMRRVQLVWILSLFLAVFILIFPYPGASLHEGVPAAGKPMLSFEDRASFPQFLSDFKESLPNFVELLMSISYQEGFLYGAKYRMPQVGESLFIERYVQTGDSIEVMRESVITYDKKWFRNILNAALNTGPGLLYGSIGGITSIKEVKIPPGTPSGKQVLFCNILLLLIVLIYCLVFLLFRRTDFLYFNSQKNKTFFYKYLHNRYLSDRAVV